MAGTSERRMIVVPSARLAAVEKVLPAATALVSYCGVALDGRRHRILRDVPIDEMIVMVCVRGSGSCTLRGRRHEVRAGQVVVLPPGLPHAYASSLDDPWVMWWVHLRVDHLEPVYRDWPPVIDVPDVYRAAGLATQIVEELERGVTDESVLLASGAAWYLLTYLAAAARRPGGTTSPLDRTRDYIHEHAADRIPVAQLAAQANLSTAHFATLFRRRFGVPVLRYQTEVRMTQARHLLATTDLSIGDIAARIGYADPFYFSRQFTAVHHVTPRDYRRSRRG
jgi:AraC-like DNA-binding protein